MVRISYRPDGYISKNDNVDAILAVWWNKDFKNRRRLYVQYLDKFSFAQQYYKFSHFVLWLNSLSLPINDDMITEYIISNEEARDELIARQQNAIKKQQNAIKRQQIMP
jgi:hypothetical protein